MNDWLSTLDLRDVWIKHIVGDVSTMGLCRIIACRLRKIEDTQNKWTDLTKDKLIDDFDYLSTNKDEQWFRIAFSQLKNWGDSSIDGKYVCRVRTH